MPDSKVKVAEMPQQRIYCIIGISATLYRQSDIIFAYKNISMAKRNKSGVSLDDVHNETLSLFHRLIGRLEKLTAECDDPGTINQALKTTADFLVKLNKERESGDDDISAVLQQTLQGL